MAYEYQSFATLGVNLNRQNYGALDISQVFASQGDLDFYLSKGVNKENVSDYWKDIVPYPYEGQVIATVFGGEVKVYVLALNAEGAFVTQNVGDTSAVEASIKALEDLVGTLPTTTDAKTIVEYINKKTEGIATSESLSQLQKELDAVEELAADNADAIGVASKPESVEGAGDAVVATGLHKKIEDEAARAKLVEEALDGRLDTVETTYAKKSELPTVPTKVSEFENDSKFQTESEVNATVNAAKEELQGKIDAIEVPVVGVADGEKVLSLTDKKLSTTLSIAKTKKADGKTYLQLVGKDAEVISEFDAAEFIKDGMLEKVEKDDTNNTITFTWNTDSGKTQTTVIDIDDLVEVYTAGNGINISNFEVSVKIDNASEGFLTVGNDGVKLSGVQTAIDNAKDAAIADAKGKVDALAKTVSDNKEAIEGTVGTLTQTVTDNKAAADATEEKAEANAQYIANHKNVEHLTTDGVKGLISSETSTMAQDVATNKGDIVNIKAKDEAQDTVIKALQDAEYQNASQVGTAIATALEDYSTSEEVSADISAAINAHNSAKEHLTTEDVNSKIDAKLAAYDTATVAEGKFVAKTTYNAFTEQYANDKEATADAIAEEAQARADADEALQTAIDGKLGEITTTANGGLKVTNKNQIDIDDSIVFILDGGTAADLIIE